jgi:hypothetical protein
LDIVGRGELFLLFLGFGAVCERLDATFFARFELAERVERFEAERFFVVEL